MLLEIFGGTTPLLQAGQIQVSILLTVRAAHSPSSAVWAPCLTHGLHGTTPLGFRTMVGEWATILAPVLGGTTDGTILTAGTALGDTEATLMVMATILTDGTTVGAGTTVGTITVGIITDGPLQGTRIKVKEQPLPQVAQREQTTVIVDLLNTPQLGVRV